jgi:arylsulfatase A-like enzyme
MRPLIHICLGALVLVTPGHVACQDSGPWTIRWQSGLLQDQQQPGVEVAGLSDEDWRRIADIQAGSPRESSLLQVFTGDSDVPLWGRLHRQRPRLVFEPRFALQPGRNYRVRFRGNELRAEVHEPLTQVLVRARETGQGVSPPPRLLSVSPCGPQLPQNVLRMYLHFSQPMAQGHACDYIRFCKADGSAMERPWLAMQQELWSPDGKRLTLLFDPGRIKQGLARRQLLGPPFQIGEEYQLIVSGRWKSADTAGGVPLGEDCRYSFSIGPPDGVQPTVVRWRIVVPRPDTLDPLTVVFEEPLDHGMLQHSLTVVSASDDTTLPGTVQVSGEGLSWQFHPQGAWSAGDYLLVANPRLEDRVGNSLAQPFERDLRAAGAAAAGASDEPQTQLRFRVGRTVSQRPNVVLILADDLGWRDLGCEGSSFYESPHIDRICHEGIRFTQGYAACQVCSPSRAAIMTGKSPARLKITDYIGAPSGTDWKRNTRLLPAFYRRHLPHEETTLAEAFRQAGYRTFFAGKWHLGSEGSHPQDHGFEINVGGHRAGTPPGGFFSPYRNPQMTDGPPGECLPERLGAETARFIEQHADQPFLAFLSFYSVHAPIQTRQRLWQKYRDKAAALPDVTGRFTVDRTLPVRQVQDHPVYAGMIESMDVAVGTVLDTLDRLGLADNSIVIFTSDNGGVSSGDGFATSNLPLRGGKGRQWEGGIREPFYIRWPAHIAAGSSSDTPVIGTDLYPTLLDLCGLPARPDQTVDGVSLKPLLSGKPIADRPLLWHYPHYGNQGGEPSSMVRRGTWKLIRYLEDGRTELYNLQTDVGEQANMAGQHPERVRSMTAILDQWLQEVSAELPVANPDFDAAAYAEWERSQWQQRLPALERNHARFHDPDFEPRQGWWDRQR